MSPRLLTARLGVAAALVALVGCTPAGGGEASPEPSASASETPVAQAPEGSPDPCALFTAESLTELVSIPMGEGSLVPDLSNAGRSICLWRPADPESTVPRVQIEINWEYPDAERHRELANETFGQTSDVEIAGAPGAWSLPGLRNFGMQAGEYFLRVSYTHPGRGSGGFVNVAISEAAVAQLTQ